MCTDCRDTVRFQMSVLSNFECRPRDIQRRTRNRDLYWDTRIIDKNGTRAHALSMNPCDSRAKQSHSESGPIAREDRKLGGSQLEGRTSPWSAQASESGPTKPTRL